MLSVEEMREKIKDYCNTTTCYYCLLDSGNHCYLDATDEEVIKNYSIINSAGGFNEDDSQEEVNQDKTQDNIHLNGYIFDSLMYRYQLARERQLMYEIMKENTNPETARHRYGRDVMKFREILEEVIGEHD